LEEIAYRDTWGRGADSFLAMIYERLAIMSDLLAADGSVYVHVDWRMSSNIRLILDELLGREMFRNEITWWYRKWSRGNKQFLRNHDSLLFYAKGEQQIFNIQRVPLAESTLKRLCGMRQDFADDDRTRKITTDEESEGAFMPDVWDINSIPANSAEKIGYATQKPEASYLV
jgi:site-specific DNA-methyltransferase (adenine-specific)/adenine-specific DNA-methyltransferase